MKLFLKKSLIFFICLSFYFISLTAQNNGNINPSGKTIKTRILPPIGFIRVKSLKNSFAEYLQNLPLKTDGYKVHYYNGAIKKNKVYSAVIDLNIGTKNLQQCADAIIRLRAEYLYKQQKFNEIHFNFTSGFNAEYKKWIQGNRVKVEGNKVRWIKKAPAKNNYQTFLKYLETVFTYAGTLSLAQELKNTPYKNLQIGDVFIQGGSPGHAVIVVDVAQNKKTGETLYLIAQSYMPAQDIHILINETNPKISPWYKLDINSEKIITPEWDFKKTDVKKF